MVEAKSRIRHRPECYILPKSSRLKFNTDSSGNSRFKMTWMDARSLIIPAQTGTDSIRRKLVKRTSTPDEACAFLFLLT